MVHALEGIHRLLKPSGTLIEIHPALEPPFVEVRSEREVSFTEDDPGFDYEEDLRHAEAAVAAVVARGMFAMEVNVRFELRTYASAAEELREHWALVGAYDADEKPEDMLRDQDAMYARAQDALVRSLGAEVVYVEPARMSRLRPLRRP